MGQAGWKWTGARQRWAQSNSRSRVEVTVEALARHSRYCEAASAGEFPSSVFVFREAASYVAEAVVAEKQNGLR
jgi:hypothetical protein